MKLSFSTEIAAVVEDFLKENEFQYIFDHDEGRFIFWLNIQCKLNHICYTIRIHEDGYTVYAVSPLNVDIEETDVLYFMCEFLHRVNYRLRKGNFEIDCEDGEIRFKLYVDCESSLPGTTGVKDNISTVAFMFQRYASGIIGVLFGGETAVEAENRSLSEICKVVKKALDEPANDPVLRDRLSLISSLLSDDDEATDDDDNLDDNSMDLSEYMDEDWQDDGSDDDGEEEPDYAMLLDQFERGEPYDEPDSEVNTVGESEDVDGGSAVGEGKKTRKKVI